MFRLNCRFILFILSVLLTCSTFASPLFNPLVGLIGAKHKMSCPAGYIGVPGSSDYSSGGFCVAKYEMKNMSGVATSTFNGLPWTNIPRGLDNTTSPSALKACSDLGSGYSLISNNQWQIIARNIADTGINWDSGVAYTGAINKGHSDGTPSGALSAVNSDFDACNQTGQGCSGVAWNAQRRTHVLSNGEVIWDFSGNVWEWVSDNNSGGGTSKYISDIAPVERFRFGNDTQCASPAVSPYCGFGYGSITGNLSTILRGGYWSEAALNYSGIFAVDNLFGNTYADSSVGFRCVFVP